MFVGRLINRALGLVGLRLSRVGRTLPLSQALTQSVEIHANPAAIVRNDLSDQFLSNSTGDIHKWHHYFEVYHHWFSRYRDRSDLRMLEIGVYHGGSLRMWHDYLDRDVRIVGIDINPRCKASEDQTRKIFVEIGDQMDTAFLSQVEAVHGPFDIILDDGGHTTTQQTVSFNVLYPGLKDGGVYMVEDLHTNYWPEYRDSEPSFVDFSKALVDRLHEPYVAYQSELYFRKGGERQIGSAVVSAFCASTRSISFHDSMVVFEKKAKSLPVSELR